MKRLILIAVLIVGLVFGLAISSYAAFGTFFDAGYVIQDNGIEDALSQGRKADESKAVEVALYDTIYSRGSSLYTGNENTKTKTSFSSTYPQFIKGGSAVKFFDDKTTLITSSFDTVIAYNGLILSEGLSYNDDNSRSDFNDYILAKLSNGLYINSGELNITTVLHKYSIPSNSIILFNKAYVSFYSLNEGVLSLERIDDIDFESTVEIGSVSISYQDFLKSLGALADAAEHNGWGKRDEEELNNKSGDGASKKNGSGSQGAGTSSESETAIEQPVRPEKVEKQKENEKVAEAEKAKEPEKSSGSTVPASAAPGEASKPKESADEKLTKIPDWKMPVVTVGDIFSPSVYALKTNVKVDDPSNVLVGGITYEINIVDTKGNSEVYKRSSFSNYAQSEFTTILIPGLMPESNYTVTGTFRYKDEYSRVQTKSIVFLPTRSFSTRPIGDLGDVYLEDLKITSAALAGDSISIPVIQFRTDSDSDAVGSMTRIILRFTEKSTAGSANPTVFASALSSSNLETLKTFQMVSGNSGRKLQSGTEYIINIDCYDRYNNLLSVKGSEAESRTCKNTPKADLEIEYNLDDATQSFTPKITNSDKIEYTNLCLKVTDALGNPVTINGLDSVPLTDGETAVVENLSQNRTYTAKVYATCDISDGKGSTEKLLGSKGFVASPLEKLGMLYLTATNITDKACPDEQFNRAVISLQLNSTLVNPNLLPFIDVLTMDFSCDTGTFSVSLTEDELKKLKAGETVIIDTKNYLADGLSSNTKYKIKYLAKKIYDRTTNDIAEIAVNSSLSSFKTGITPSEVLVSNLSVFEGYISMEVRIKDVDQVIDESNVVMNVYMLDEDENKTLVGAFNIPTNQLETQKIKMTSDGSSSSDGIAYNILPNTKYLFSFVAAEILTNDGLKTNYEIDSFTRETTVSISGKIYNGGLTDNGNGTMNAVLYMDMADPEDFLDGVVNKKVIYVDEINNLGGTETLITTRAFNYEGHYLSAEMGWRDTDGVFFTDDYVASHKSNFYTQLPQSAAEKGYRQVEYIESEGNAYIELDYEQKSETDRIIVSYQTTAVGSKQFIAGSIDKNGKGVLIAVNSNGIGDSQYAALSTKKVGALTQARSVSQGISGKKIYVFAGNEAGLPTNFAKVKIYSMNVLNEDSVFFDLIPCVDKDGVAGFYNLVDDSFITAGFGELLAGPEVLIYSEVEVDFDTTLPSGYVRLEYISSTTTPYISTGLRSATKIEARVKGEYTSQYTGFWGNHVDEDTNSIRLIWKTFSGECWSTFNSRSAGSLSIPSFSANQWHDVVQYNEDKKFITEVDGNRYSQNVINGKGNFNIISLFRSGPKGNYSKSSISYWRAWNGDELVRNFVACLDLYTGEAGMYELVEGKFYVSPNGKAFVPSSNNYVVRANSTISSFETTVNEDNKDGDTYIYNMYFKLNQGTDDEFTVPISSIEFTTNEEIGTISSGDEFKSKCVNKKKYVVINDISLDNTDSSSVVIGTMYANIDFQGFSFTYYVNYTPAINNNYGTISNAVLKSMAPLYRKVLSETKTTIRSGPLVWNNYGLFNNVYIEQYQEEFPYIYENGLYWSDLSPEEMDNLIALSEKEKKSGTSDDENSYTSQLAAAKYMFPAQTESLTVNNYGKVTNFVVDVKTPLYAMDYCSAISAYTGNGGEISNGYIFSSTLPNNSASLYLTSVSYTGSAPTLYCAGAVSGHIQGKGTVVSNVYAIAGVQSYVKSRENIGILLGRNSGSGAIIRDCYAVGDIGYVTNNGKPTTETRGPVVGTAATPGDCKNDYYYSANTYNNTYNFSTTLLALKSVTWQNSILNTDDSDTRFEVDSNVSIGCFPQVRYTSKCMPAQPMISLPGQYASGTVNNWEIVYAYTYRGDTSNINNADIMSAITTPGVLAWDGGSEEQILCVMIDNKSQTNIYSIQVNNFPDVGHDDVIYQVNNGEGLTIVYLRMHDPVKCLTNYTFNSVTFALDDQTGAKPSAVKGTKYAYMEYFWKISSPGDWEAFRAKYSANTTCSENMQLTEDISFGGEPFNKYSWYSVKYTGKVFGNGHIISDIDYDANLAGTLGVFTAGASTIGLFSEFDGIAKDLTIDNAAIEGNNITGIFAGYLNEASLSNIFVKNSYVGGGSKTGGLIGYTDVAEIDSCGVADTKVLSFASGSASPRCAGGFAGQLGLYSEISRCFAQNVYVESYDGYCTGGFAGLYAVGTCNGFIQACYATGNLVSTDHFAGGFIGVLGSKITVENCYSDTDVYSFGAQCGGFAGSAVGTVSRIVSFGNVSSMQIVSGSDEKVTKNSLQGLRGSVFSSGVMTGLVFSESKLFQPTSTDGTINELTHTAKSCAGGTELSYDDYVSGKIYDLISSSYFAVNDYTDGILPVLKNKNGEVMPYQNTEYIASSDSDAMMQIESINTVPHGLSYDLLVTISHPKDVEIKNVYTDFTFADKMSNMIDSNGNHLGQTSFAKMKTFNGGAVSSTVIYGDKKNKSIITISNLQKDKAYDTYWLTGISYEKEGKESVLRISQQLPVSQEWKLITSADQWLQTVAGSHYENFRIAADIDFNNYILHSYDGTTNMIINRLVGTKGTNEGYENPNEYYTFKNITVDEQATTMKIPNGAQNIYSWGFIKSVVSELTHIGFDNVVLDNYYASYSGIINSVVGINNGISFTNIRLHCYNYCGAIVRGRGSTSYVYLDNIENISSINTIVYSMAILFENIYPGTYNCQLSHVTASNMRIEQSGTNYGRLGFISMSYNAFYGDYSGIFYQSSKSNSVSDVKITDFYIKGRTKYVGALCGLAWKTAFDNCTLENCELQLSPHSSVNDYSGAGLLVGYTTNADSEIKNCIISDCILNATTCKHVGAAVGRYNASNKTISNIQLNNSRIVGGTNTGGIAGWSIIAVNNCTVDACDIVGKGDYTGGIVGYSVVHLTGHEIRNTAVAGVNYTGGIAGYFAGGDLSVNTVDNCKISGRSYVGGVFGIAEGYAKDCYVKDSTIIGSGSRVGGLIGTGKGPRSGNVIENTTIVGKETYTGGSAGYITGISSKVANSMISGENNYAAWIKNCMIVGNKSVGGSFGTMYIQNIATAQSFVSLVEDSSVYGVSCVGGILGGSAANSSDYVRNSYIKNSNISQLSSELQARFEFNLTVTSYSEFGTIFGRADYANNCLAENCVVDAPDADYVGGIGGFFNPIYSSSITQNNLISKDCVVRGRNYVGGMFGNIHSSLVSSYVMKETASRDADTYRPAISNCVSNALVYGENYVGGFAGMYEAPQTSFSVKVANKQIDYNDIYGLAVKITDSYFTGALNANTSNGRAAGVFAAVNVRTSDSQYGFPDVSSDQWTIKLQGIGSFPSYIKGYYVDPVITNYSASPLLTEQFTFEDLAAETVPQFVSLWAKTRVESNIGNTDMNAYASQSYGNCSEYVGNLDTVYGMYTQAKASKSRNPSDRFIAIVDTATTVASGNTELVEKFHSMVLENSRSFEYEEYNGSSFPSAEYIPLTYVESNGTQKIDTGINFDYSKKNEMEFIFSIPSSAKNYLLSGSHPSNNSMTISISPEYRYHIVCKGVDTGYSTAKVETNRVSKISYVIENGTATSQLYGNTFKVAVPNSGISATAQGIFLDTRLTNSPYGGYKLYGYKHVVDGVTEANYAPAQRKSDGMVGLYDLAKNKFVLPVSASSTTAPLSAGPVKVLVTGRFAPLVTLDGYPIFNIKLNASTQTGRELSTEMNQCMAIPDLRDSSDYKQTLANMESMYTSLQDNKLPSGIGTAIYASTEVIEKVGGLFSFDNTGIKQFTISLNSGFVNENIGDEGEADYVYNLSYSLKNLTVNTGGAVASYNKYEWINVAASGSIDNTVREKNFEYNYLDTYKLTYEFTTEKGKRGSGELTIDRSLAKDSMTTNDGTYTFDSSGVLTKSPDTYVFEDVVNLYEGKLLTKRGQILDVSSFSIPGSIVLVDYLESTGTQYIDTGIVPNQDYSFEIDARIIAANGSSRYIFGSRDTDITRAFYLNGYNGAGTYSSGYGSSAGASSKKTDLKRHLFVRNRNLFYIDGELVLTNALYDFTCPGSAYIFADNLNGGKVHNPSKSRVYSVKLWDGNNIVALLKPCYNTGTGKYGMYDIVRNQFYGNMGTGDFTGPAIN